MGKYHPHGDGAIYEAMVRLGQDFSMSVPFVAQRATSAVWTIRPPPTDTQRLALTEAAMTMVEDLDEDTVDFSPNLTANAKNLLAFPPHYRISWLMERRA